MNRQVTVIVRTKDRPKLLRRALKSIEDQTYPHHETVVVNWGSPGAKLQEIISKKESIRLIEREGLNGSAASNAAINLAKSPWITHLDDDDSWEPTFLEEGIHLLEAQNDLLGVACHSNRIIEKRGSFKKRPYPLKPKQITLHALLTKNLFTNNAFIFSKEAWEELKGFDENLTMFEDWDFNLRYLLKYKVGLIPKRLANYHFTDLPQRLGERTDKEALLETFVDFQLKKDLLKGKRSIGTLMAERHNLKREITLFNALKNDLKRLLQLIKS